MADKHAHSSNPDTIAALARLDRQFMTPSIVLGDCWEVQANHGETHYVPASVCSRAAGEDFSMYVEGTIDEDETPVLRVGVFMAKLSASGYMDQTDLSVFDTLAEAEDYLAETYDDGEEEL